MRRVVLLMALSCAAACLIPVMTFAQERAAIAGVVKDGTGAVLPGVTVEASSPALIEKTRTVVTDTAGQYKIVDLGPGVYDVTFTIAGFKTVKRTGIVLEGNLTAQVSPELAVGAVEETLTVTVSSTAPTCSSAFTGAVKFPSRMIPARRILLNPGSVKVTS